MIYTLFKFCFFIPGRWIFIYIYNILKVPSFFSAKNSFNTSYTEYWNLLDSSFSKSFGKFVKPCQTDELLFHTQILPSKMKRLIILTKLRMILNLFKLKHLLYQRQIKIILHNKILCKYQNLLFLRCLLDK